MKKILTKTIAILFIFIYLVQFYVVSAASRTTLDNAVSDAAKYMYNTVKNPEVGSFGGEWAVLGLARSSYNVPDSYYENYYKTVEKYVKDKKGVLDERKYTEYSRVILGLTTAGYDTRNVGGYDLTLPLGDFEKTIWQGINGPVFALLALDCMGYPMPENKSAKTQATRDLYIQEILSKQLKDGGWNLSGDTGSPDITGMVLQALAKYQSKSEVKSATNKAVEFLSKNQNNNGGYSNLEDAAQVLTALCELGISPDDSRFVKNNKTLVDNILSFKNTDGSFNHTNNSGANQLSTEQALYSLVAAQRALDGKNSLFRMSDVKKRVTFASTEEIEIKKHPDVKVMPVTSPGKTFTDIKGHKNKKAIEVLASRGIINGKSDTIFDPDSTMTRAEFATITVRGLGLKEKKVTVFTDVSSNEWYAGYIGSAYSYGIVTGTSATTFNPNGTITRQEAAVMVARAAKLCGIDTSLTNAQIRDILVKFGDYTKSADWARESLAFCYKENILSQDDSNIRPLDAIKRCEVAEMLYRMLKSAELL